MQVTGQQVPWEVQLRSAMRSARMIHATGLRNVKGSTIVFSFNDRC
jgi:hypothetical protein